jgi:hypothetical protein
VCAADDDAPAADLFGRPVLLTLLLYINNQTLHLVCSSSKTGLLQSVPCIGSLPQFFLQLAAILNVTTLYTSQQLCFHS